TSPGLGHVIAGAQLVDVGQVGVAHYIGAVAVDVAGLGCAITGERTPGGRDYIGAPRVGRVAARNEQRVTVVDALVQAGRVAPVGFAVVEAGLQFELQPVSGVPGEVVEQCVVTVGTCVVVLLAVVEQAGAGAQRLAAGERAWFGRVVVASVVGAAGRVTHGRACNNAA